MFVLKLPRFFTHLYGAGKRAAISKPTYIWTSLSRSYIILALKMKIKVSNKELYILQNNQKLQKIRIFKTASGRI